MTITEPVTMLTDYLLALFSGFYFLQLLRSTSMGSQRSVKLWAIGFLLAAFAAVAGGTFHGFTAHFDSGARKTLWNVTVFLLGSSAAFMVAGTLVASIPRTSESAKWLLMGLATSALGLTLLAVRLSLHEHFNQNDIYHCVQIVGLYFFYRGAKGLQDGKTEQKP